MPGTDTGTRLVAAPVPVPSITRDNNATSHWDYTYDRFQFKTIIRLKLVLFNRPRQNELKPYCLDGQFKQITYL